MIGWQRVGAAVLTQRLDDDGAEQILAAHHEAGHRLADLRVGAVRGERARQRRTHELRLLFRERRQQPGHDLRDQDDARTSAYAAARSRSFRSAITLTIVVPDARVVEARQHDQRLEADVGVAVTGDGLEQRRHGDRRTRRGGRCGSASIRTGKSSEPSRSIAGLDLGRRDLFGGGSARRAAGAPARTSRDDS